ncbi:unnamed protein product [Protopolystoma xenopodis]|uniref:Uncharacterized protein n=1 Tax=Protopolystoma xenopodis TaxID=117903 RepID=A0A448XCV9_9PLAT|nr:unnamed protein product [Protopolystoma xenopodis]
MTGFHSCYLEQLRFCYRVLEDWVRHNHLRPFPDSASVSSPDTAATMVGRLNTNGHSLTGRLPAGWPLANSIYSICQTPVLALPPRLATIAVSAAMAKDTGGVMGSSPPGARLTHPRLVGDAHFDAERVSHLPDANSSNVGDLHEVEANSQTQVPTFYRYFEDELHYLAAKPF